MTLAVFRCSCGRTIGAIAGAVVRCSCGRRMVREPNEPNRDAIKKELETVNSCRCKVTGTYA
jgi:hypothetical protein